LIGAVLGSVAGIVLDDLLVAYAIAVLMTCVGLVWRRGDPPVLPFILTYQWVSVTAGYWYQQLFETFPGDYRPGDIPLTMTLALTGLLVLTAGIRIVAELIAARAKPVDAQSAEAGETSFVRPLFVLVIAAYAIDYVYTINPRDFGGFASFVQRALEFRQVFLVTLWLEIVRSRRYVPLLLVSFVWAVVPRLGSYYSDFKNPLVLMLITLAATWRPWESGWWRRSIVPAAKVTPFVGILLVLLLIWQGGLKRNTRVAHDQGVLGADTRGRVSFFVENFRTELPQLFVAPEPYVEALVERISYITFFSRVLEYVPDKEPHADGELLKIAFSNAFVPRVLVPEKPELPSDSYYTRRFTGIQVAETGTSISIGYMAEFYADWGIRGMFLSVFLFGCWIGVIDSVVRLWNPIPALRFAALTVVLLAVSDFEQQFIKGFAALNLNAAMTLCLLAVAKPWVEPLLTRRDTTGKAPAVVDAAAVARVTES
jgi:hypothetical protein